MSRTKHGHIDVQCDGCGARAQLPLDAVALMAPTPSEGWARITCEVRDGHHVRSNGVIDLCPACLARVPWRATERTP